MTPKYQPSVIEFPSGKFGIVGTAPGYLLYENKDGSQVDPLTLEKQLRLPASHRTIKTRVWETRESCEESLRQWTSAAADPYLRGLK